MEYITGIHALNIENSLNTCGDWHTSALKWQNIEVLESTKSIFGNWGIEQNKKIPEHKGFYNVANDLRAILDMLEQGRVRYLKGFYNDFIGTDEYNTEFFKKVILLKDSKYWNEINHLMKMEFMWEWDKFIQIEEKR